MSSSHQNVDGLAGALLGIGAVVVGLRFLARKLQKGRFQADDWLMIPAYVFYVGFLACALYATQCRALGYNITETYMDPPSPQQTVNVFIALDVLAALFFGCVKASALCFFQRVFCMPGKDKRDPFQVAIWILLVLTAIWTLLYIFLPIFQCGPDISVAWGPPEAQAEACKNATGIVESQSVTDTVFDFIILVLPIHKIWSLCIDPRKRLGVLFVFATAAVSLAASMAKTIIIYQIYNMEISGDILEQTTVSYFMWVLEAGFAIIAVNLPSLVWFRTAKPPEKMLNSIRSFLSIGSGSSRGSHDASKTARTHSQDTRRTGSVATLAPGQANLHKEPMPEHGITVTREVRQEIEHV